MARMIFQGRLLHTPSNEIHHFSWAKTISINSSLVFLCSMLFLMIYQSSQTTQNAFLPDNSLDRKDPSVSPLYFDFPSLIASGKSLPPAVFTCGTEDMLLDDTIFMSAKWQMAGGETLVKILPGAPHGFTLFPDVMPGVKETVELTIKFLKEKTHSETSPCLKN